ncbi:septation protein SepH [Sanguibacter sp. 25GB23B1]|uniref:septation protein SepH n=1 Tax=unclassified Sanguibacter TaxID=2645534 RepID=UPI0032AFE933
MVELSAGELRLVGLHDDGEHLLLASPGGAQYRLPITDALRAAVRRDRPQLEHLRSTSAGFLPPREIQSRVRAGMTAEEIATSAGITVEQVRRYEGPVLAEREFIAQQAAATRVGRDSSSPTLGDLVTDRLAARGVDTSDLAWDAARPDGHGWIVSVGFEVGGQDRLARWTFDHSAHALHALEDEARWLSETEIADEPIPRRHLAAVRSTVFDVEADGSIRPVLDAVDARHPGASPTGPTPDELAETALDETSSLLDDLRGRRGVRQQVDLHDDDDDGFEGFGPPAAFDLDRPGPRPVGDAPGAHPLDTGSLRSARVYPVPSSASPAPGGADERDDAHGTDHDAPPVALDEGARPAPRRAAGSSSAPSTGSAPTVSGGSGSRPSGPGSSDAVEASSEHADPEDRAAVKGRAPRRARSKVPSWDEIVFGAKPE